MQDTEKGLNLSKGFKLDIFDMWEFEKTDIKIEYPYYEISYSSKKVYISNNITNDRIKKIVLNAVKDICLTNYGGGRENPFIEWLSKNADITIISK